MVRWVKNMSEGRRRMLHVVTLVLIVLGGIYILNSSSKTTTLELSFQGKAVNAKRVEAEVRLLPEEEMAHRAVFFFQPTEAPEQVAVKMRLQQGRRYRVDLSLAPSGSDPADEAIQGFSREFLFQGESSLRIYF